MLESMFFGWNILMKGLIAVVIGKGKTNRPTWFLIYKRKPHNKVIALLQTAGTKPHRSGAVWAELKENVFGF